MENEDTFQKKDYDKIKSSFLSYNLKEREKIRS